MKLDPATRRRVLALVAPGPALRKPRGTGKVARTRDTCQVIDNAVYVYVYAAAMGAVRQNRSDKWKKRDCVLRYRAWCDRLCAACPKPPKASEVEEVKVIAYYRMPKDWSEKKKLAHMGTKKRTKPDGDNVFKGCADALWEDDQELGDQVTMRRWNNEDYTVIVIRFSEAGAP